MAGFLGASAEQARELAYPLPPARGGRACPLSTDVRIRVSTDVLGVLSIGGRLASCLVSPREKKKKAMIHDEAVALLQRELRHGAAKPEFAPHTLMLAASRHRAVAQLW